MLKRPKCSGGQAPLEKDGDSDGKQQGKFKKLIRRLFCFPNPNVPSTLNLPKTVLGNFGSDSILVPSTTYNVKLNSMFVKYSVVCSVKSLTHQRSTGNV